MFSVGCEISPFIPTRSEPIGDCGVGFNPYDASTWGPCIFAIGYWSMGCALDNHVHVSYVGE